MPLAKRKIICEHCKRWMSMPDNVENVLKLDKLARDAGWHNIHCTNRKRTRGRCLWYCESCLKKVTIAQMVASVGE